MVLKKLGKKVKETKLRILTCENIDNSIFSHLRYIEVELVNEYSRL